LILGKNAPWRNPSVEVVLNLPIGYKATSIAVVGI